VLDASISDVMSTYVAVRAFGAAAGGLAPDEIHRNGRTAFFSPGMVGRRSSLGVDHAARTDAYHGRRSSERTEWLSVESPRRETDLPA